MTRVDLGVLATLSLSPLVLGAPSRLTRVVWLAGGIGCLVFLWSVASTVGWLTPGPTGFGLGRAPTLFETVLWLPPLLLAGFALGMGLGGVRLSFFDEGLEVRSQWPSRARTAYPWSTLRYARFFEEATRSRERLFVMRFVFAEAEMTLRVADEHVWTSLRERFGA